MGVFEIRISGETVEEVHAKLLKICQEFGMDTGAHSTPAEEPVYDSSKPRRGRPPKVVAAPAAPVVPSASDQTMVESAPETKPAAPSVPVVAAAPAPMTATQEQAAEALKTVLAKKDIGVVREVLGKFNASKLSQVKAEDYGALVQACNQATA